MPSLNSCCPSSPITTSNPNTAVILICPSTFTFPVQLQPIDRSFFNASATHWKDRVVTLFITMMECNRFNSSRPTGLLSVRHERRMPAGNGMLPGRMLPHDLSRGECDTVFGMYSRNVLVRESNIWLPKVYGTDSTQLPKTLVPLISWQIT